MLVLYVFINEKIDTIQHTANNPPNGPGFPNVPVIPKS